MLGENGYMYVTESLFSSPETIKTLLISYTLYKIKSFFFEEDTVLKAHKCGYNMTEYTSID